MIGNATGHRPFQKARDGQWISKLEFTSKKHGKVSRFGKLLYFALVRLAVRALQKSPQPLEEMRVGMAMGWDLAVGRACIELGIPVVAFVPHAGHGQEWRTFYRDEWIFVRDHAVRVLDDQVPFSRDALLARNIDMLTGSEWVLALWDRSGGGTGHCVKSAVERGVPYTNVWEEWLACREALLDEAVSVYGKEALV